MLPANIGVSEEVQRFTNEQLVPMDGQALHRVLNGAQGRPTLVFVYASWCPWCKKQFPMLRALQARYNDSQLNVVYTSVDKDAFDLSRFLMDEFPQQPFTPFHVAPRNLSGFYDTLGERGFSPQGGVPYLVLVDGQGQRAGEFRGLTEIPVLLEAIKKTL